MLCVRARRDQNQWDDFAAVRPHMRRGSGIFIFHDVTLARMYRSLHAIQQDAAGPVRVYRSVNHCNEFGTALLASGSEAALPSTFGPALEQSIAPSQMQALGRAGPCSPVLVFAVTKRSCE